VIQDDFPAVPKGTHIRLHDPEHRDNIVSVDGIEQDIDDVIVFVGTPSRPIPLRSRAGFPGPRSRARKPRKRTAAVVPLMGVNDLAHLLTGTLSDGTKALMNLSITNGQRELPTKLDMAVLSDVGYEITP